MHPDTLSERRRLYLLGRVVVSRYYRRPLTLAAVARAISTSPRQLQRAYAQFGDSFHEDLLARRMSVAAQLLSEQRALAVGDVGRLVGYRSSSYFACAFRRRYGLSPALFRDRALRHAAARHGRAGPTVDERTNAATSGRAGPAMNGRTDMAVRGRADLARRGRAGSRPRRSEAPRSCRPDPAARPPAG